MTFSSSKGRSSDSAKTAPFAMVPLEIIESGLPARAIVLYAQLVARQGKDSRYVPFGQHFLADRIGWQKETYGKHARTLERHGLIKIIISGMRKHRFLVIHNPSWGADRVNPDVRIPRPEPKHHKAGSIGVEATAEEMRAIRVGPKYGTVMACDSGETDPYDGRRWPDDQDNFAQETGDSLDLAHRFDVRCGSSRCGDTRYEDAPEIVQDSVALEVPRFQEAAAQRIRPVGDGEPWAPDATGPPKPVRTLGAIRRSRRTEGRSEGIGDGADALLEF